jgi:autotransporter passenger strand-loop-strand repeat protein
MTVQYVTSFTTGLILTSGSTAIVQPGGVADVAFIYSGGVISVNSGGTALQDLILSGGSIEVDGGVAAANSVTNGATLTVYSGTALANAVYSGGFMDIFGSGAVASSDVIASAGTMVVELGGSAKATRVNRDGFLEVGYLGVVSAAVISSGGFMEVDSGATANGATISSGGYLASFTGANISGTNVLAGGTIITSGVFTFSPRSGVTLLGSAVNSAPIPNPGTMFVFQAGTATGETVTSGNRITTDGGTALGTIVSSGGVDVVSAGTDSGAAIQSGGIQGVIYSGIAVSAMILSGGTQGVYFYGVASSAIISSGGVQIAYIGGTAINAKISRGGAQTVFYDGVASGTVISSSGVQSVTNLGLAVATIVSSGGFEFVYSGGTGSLTTIASGGVEDVFYGGTGADSLISGGKLFVDSGGTLAGEAIFQGGGTLELASGFIDGGPIVSAPGQGVIDLQPSFGFTTATAATVTNVGTVQIGALSLQIAGAYPGEHFHLVADPTLGGFDLVCFLEGTRIATPAGEIAVEDLHQDDLVLTASGEAKPIVWIGMRRMDTARLKDRHLAAPICVQAGAIAEGEPKRDLWVTPDHALFVDGKLIPARLLVNGVSIRQVPRARYTYYHIELEPHGLLLAEGLAAESYLDIEASRQQFANHSVTALHPAPPLASVAQAAYEARGCVPLSLSAEAVKPVWERLAARAGGAATADTTDEPDLHLLVAGARIASRITGAGRYRFPLPPGASEAVIASRAAAPNAAAPWLEDRRMLGVAIGAMRLLAGDAAVDLPLAGGQGWHGLETDPAAGAQWRWTDGAAVLPLPARDAPRWLELTVTGTQRYPVAGEARAKRPA